MSPPTEKQGEPGEAEEKCNVPEDDQDWQPDGRDWEHYDEECDRGC